MNQFFRTIAVSAVSCLLLVSCNQDQKEENNLKVSTTNARVEGFEEETPSYILEGITVYEVMPDNGFTMIKSLQEKYNLLKALPEVVVGKDTNYVFISMDNGNAFRLTHTDNEIITLRTAENEEGLITEGAYREEAFESSDLNYWSIDAKIMPAIFFEELVSALRMLKGSDIKLPMPEPGQPPFRRARCQGNTNNPHNTGSVITCLHAHAAADCGGTNSYTHSEPRINANGNGSMTYHCNGD